jgi:hypothetical protein
MAYKNNIDDEWAEFLDPEFDDLLEEPEETQLQFATNNTQSVDSENSVHEDGSPNIPDATDIYISTKSKIAYLNQELDLSTIFWKVLVIPYALPSNGVIKKQMKFNSTTPEEVSYIDEQLKKEVYTDVQILTSIDNPTGRIKFKDIRKIGIGISKKDIMSYRCKKKSAFYNCFVMILRIKIHDTFKEFHVKVFNTGKLEIPGIQTDYIYEQVLLNILKEIQPFIDSPLEYKQISDTILINSNFNCGFYINREVLFDIIKYKYNIQCIYDHCSYPGVQCKFYYDPLKTEQTGSISDEEKHKGIVTVSFMIFRTGSILIVGMCDETVLYHIYDFLKIMLKTEYHKISQKNINKEQDLLNKNKKKKVRRKTIMIDV